MHDLSMWQFWFAPREMCIGYEKTRRRLLAVETRERLACIAQEVGRDHCVGYRRSESNSDLDFMGMYCVKYRFYVLFFTFPHLNIQF